VPELRVLVTCPPMQRTAHDWLDEFSSRGIEVELPAVVQQLTREELKGLLPAFDGMIAGDDPLDREVLTVAPRLRVISRWGVGMDNVDIDAARDLGIRVTNTPAVFADEVADVVLGYLLMLSRRLHLIDQGVRTGSWPKLEGISLRDRTLGIVGLGAIGREVARRGISVGMRVVGYDANPHAQAIAGENGVEALEFEALLALADVVSLNCPLTESNRHMISSAALASMRPGAFLINTARGPLVDETALSKALASGRLGGAALDVFEEEPLPSSSPLRAYENVILGAHNASNTAEAVKRTNERAIANLLEALAESAG
jgi:phosphoglycerate dehydrogenase-like enzyme